MRLAEGEAVGVGRGEVVRTSPDRLGRWAGASTVALILGVVLLRLADTVADPDLWGHVRFGLDILRTGQVVQSDPYSYRSDGQPWINHEWLAEVLFGAAYRLAGPAGLVGLRIGIVLMIFGIAYAYLGRQGLGPLRAGILLLVALLPLRMSLGTVRPQLFTCLAFLLILVALNEASRGRMRWLWLVPAVLVVWVNLHGGFLAGVGCLGIWTLARLAGLARGGPRPARDRRAEALGLAGLLVLSGLVLVLNPYGPRLLAFLLRTATVARPEIGEWGPLPIASVAGLTYLALVAIAVAALWFSRCRRDPAALLVLAATAVLPLLSVRHLPLFALAVLVLTGEHVADAWERRSPEGRPTASTLRTITVLNLVGAATFLGLALPQARRIRLDPDLFGFPVRAVALLRHSGVAGNLAIHFDWGEYALWHLGPRIKVSLDGRRETVYDTADYREQLDFLTGTGDWDALLRRPETHMTLVGRGTAADNLLRLRPDWPRVYQDSFCALFVRRGSPHRGPLEATRPPDLPPDGRGLSFP